MHSVVISGTGLWKPEEYVTNEELVDSYNAYATQFNDQNADAIAARPVGPPWLDGERAREDAGRLCSRLLGIGTGRQQRPAGLG